MLFTPRLLSAGAKSGYCFAAVSCEECRGPRQPPTLAGAKRSSAYIAQWMLIWPWSKARTPSEPTNQNGIPLVLTTTVFSAVAPLSLWVFTGQKPCHGAEHDAQAGQDTGLQAGGGHCVLPISWRAHRLRCKQLILTMILSWGCLTRVGLVNLVFTCMMPIDAF